MVSKVRYVEICFQISCVASSRLFIISMKTLASFHEETLSHQIGGSGKNGEGTNDQPYNVATSIRTSDCLKKNQDNWRGK